jgi:hypothetical protein
MQDGWLVLRVAQSWDVNSKQSRRYIWRGGRRYRHTHLHAAQMQAGADSGTQLGYGLQEQNCRYIGEGRWGGGVTVAVYCVRRTVPVCDCTAAVSQEGLQRIVVWCLVISRAGQPVACSAGACVSVEGRHVASRLDPQNKRVLVAAVYLLCMCAS